MYLQKEIKIIVKENVDVQVTPDRFSAFFLQCNGREDF